MDNVKEFFCFENAIYFLSRKGYCYKVVNDSKYGLKSRRISQAQYNNMNTQKHGG